MDSSNNDLNPEIRQMLVSNFDQIKVQKKSTNKIYQTYDYQADGSALLSSRNGKSQAPNLISENSNCTDLQVHMFGDEQSSKNQKPDKQHMALNITDVATIAKNQMEQLPKTTHNITGRHYGFNSYSLSKGQKVHTKNFRNKSNLPKILEQNQ